MQLFLWEKVKGTEMTSSTHPTPMLIMEGLGVEVKEGKSLETAEGREKAQERTKCYERCQRKEVWGERCGKKWQAEHM